MTQQRMKARLRSNFELKKKISTGPGPLRSHQQNVIGQFWKIIATKSIQIWNGIYIEMDHIWQNELTHYGQVTSYDLVDLGHHWFR